MGRVDTTTVHITRELRDRLDGVVLRGETMEGVVDAALWRAVREREASLAARRPCALCGAPSESSLTVAGSPRCLPCSLG